MKFVPYEQAGDVPNIVVDGAATTNTLLTLSHWPKSGTPAALKRDTSAEIAFAWLNSPDFRVEAEAVSNNHFDEDGLVGIFALLQPEQALRHRELLIDAAQAGDFGVYKNRSAARIAMTLSAYADPASSPLPGAMFEQSYPDMAGTLYFELLSVLPRLLTHLDQFRTLWEKDDSRLTASEQALDAGTISIEERPELDLAIVRFADELGTAANYHPMALHSRTPRTRLLLLAAHRAELHYRYEGWVQLVSRRPAPRVDLAGLAEELNAEESSGGHWIFDGVDQITPKLRLAGGDEEAIIHSTIPVKVIQERIERALATGFPAWDPYDSIR